VVALLEPELVASQLSSVSEAFRAEAGISSVMQHATADVERLLTKYRVSAAPPTASAAGSSRYAASSHPPSPAERYRSSSPPRLYQSRHVSSRWPNADSAATDGIESLIESEASPVVKAELSKVKNGLLLERAEYFTHRERAFESEKLQYTQQHEEERESVRDLRLDLKKSNDMIAMMKRDHAEELQKVPNSHIPLTLRPSQLVCSPPADLLLTLCLCLLQARGTQPQPGLQGPVVLAYWGIRGLAQPIRLLLEYTGCKYVKPQPQPHCNAHCNPNPLHCNAPC